MICNSDILVTGGAGFIGSHLVEALAPMNRVIVIDDLSVGRLSNLDKVINNIIFIQGDLGNVMESGEIRNFDLHYIFHLAARADIVPSIVDPHDYYNSNVTGTFKLLEFARQLKSLRRLFYAASSSCYGLTTQYPTPETAGVAPEYPYALTKAMGEQLVSHWRKVYGIPTVVGRFFNVYGPRARTSGTYGAVMGVFIAQMLAGQPLTIVGDGFQRRDFTFVSDCVEAVLALATSNNLLHEAYNIGTGIPRSVNELAALISSDRVHIPKRPGEPDLTHADISRITTETAWRPRVTLEQGLAAMLADTSYWLDAPVWSPESISHATKEWFRF